MTFLSWLGTLKSRNEDITSDALRIGQLEAALKAEKRKVALWKAIAFYFARSKEYTTGVKRLAAIAKYRRGK